MLVTWCMAALLAAPAQQASSHSNSTRETLATGEARDQHGRSGLLRAGLDGDRATFQRVLELDRLRLDAATRRAAQPLSESAMALVRARQARRRLIDEPDADGVTPLMVAAQRGWDDLVSVLLDAGAKPSSRIAPVSLLRTMPSALASPLSPETCAERHPSDLFCVVQRHPRVTQP